MANLQLSIRVQATLLGSMCHAMPFSAKALKKKIGVDVVVKTKSNVVYVVCTLTSRVMDGDTSPTPGHWKLR